MIIDMILELLKERCYHSFANHEWSMNEETYGQLLGILKTYKALEERENENETDPQN